jgi:hypothetical protein
MTPKEKAEALYVSARTQHGLEKAKIEALNTAVTVKTLAPIELKNYWENVIDNLTKKK